MEISVLHQGDVTILELEGDLTHGSNQRRFLEEVERVVANGSSNLVVDMAGVQYVDSSGLGALIRGYTACAQTGGKVQLKHVSPQLRNLLAVARLTDVLEIVY